MPGLDVDLSSKLQQNATLSVVDYGRDFWCACQVSIYQFFFRALALFKRTKKNIPRTSNFRGPRDSKLQRRPQLQKGWEPLVHTICFSCLKSRIIKKKQR